MTALIKKLIRQGYLPTCTPTIEELCAKADEALFSAILSDPGHVLHGLLPPIRETGYCLRRRPHSRTIPQC